jgi:putative Mg2+ transporter-C (MgtC) family protein
VLHSLINWIVADRTIPSLPLAFLLGAMVGAEREWANECRGRPAYLRAGSVAAAAFPDLMATWVDPANLGAGLGAIATGVGFLGAGANMRAGATIHGLSIAATIWCVAAIGAQAGVGEVTGAIWLTILVLLIDTVLVPVQRLIHWFHPRQRVGEDTDLEGLSPILHGAEVLTSHRPSPQPGAPGD